MCLAFFHETAAYYDARILLLAYRLRRMLVHRDLFGAGLRDAAVMALGERLHRIGITTVAELAHVPVSLLQRVFGPVQGSTLADLAWGRDSRRVIATTTERSIGTQETFAQDTDDPGVVSAELLRVTARTAQRMRTAQLLGRTVVLSVRFADFTSVTRDITLPAAVGSAREIRQAARQCLKRIIFEQRMRLLGVRASGLQARVPVMTQGDQGELPL